MLVRIEEAQRDNISLLTELMVGLASVTINIRLLRSQNQSTLPRVASATNTLPLRFCTAGDGALARRH
jgi:hypothetical protein